MGKLSKKQIIVNVVKNLNNRFSHIGGDKPKFLGFWDNDNKHFSIGTSDFYLYMGCDFFLKTSSVLHKVFRKKKIPVIFFFQSSVWIDKLYREKEWNGKKVQVFF